MLVLLAMLLTMLTWLAWGTVLIGIGSGVSRWFGHRFMTLHDVFRAFWIGFVLTLVILQLWHLVLPLNGLATGGVAAVGVVGFALIRHEIGAILARYPWRDYRVLAVGLLTLCFGIYLANRSIGYPLDGDSGLYHVSFIMWARDFPIVPGLANLNENFGFNNAGFLYAALLDNGLWRSHSNHFANSLLMMMLSLQTAACALRLWRHTVWQPEDVVFVLGSGLLLMLTNANSIASHSTDLMVSFLALVTLYEYIGHGRQPSSTAITYYRHAVMIMWCIGSLFLKLSLVGFFFTIGFITLGHWLSGLLQKPNGVDIRRFVGIGLLGIAAIGVWLVRGVILSGYPLFPMVWGAQVVDWQLPEAIVQGNMARIQAYGRLGVEFGLSGTLPYDQYQGWAWLPTWVMGAWSNLYYGRLPIMFTLIAVGSLLAGWWSRRWRLPVGAGGWLLPIVIGLFVWFINSPQLRFASALIWLGVIVLWGWIVLGWQNISLQNRRRWVGILWLIGLAYPLFLAVRTDRVLTEPGSAWGFYSSDDFAMQATLITTSTGLTLYFSSHCYYQQLLCTPYPKETLTWRVPQEYAHGFRLVSAAD
jgi:hypothetical protein